MSCLSSLLIDRAVMLTDSDCHVSDLCNQVDEAESSSACSKCYMDASALWHKAVAHRSLDFEPLVVLVVVDLGGETLRVAIVLDAEAHGAGLVPGEVPRVEGLVLRVCVRLQSLDVAPVDVRDHGVADGVVS